jgi:hypothetical protein
MLSPPVISDKQPHDSPESGEGAGHPRPERPGCAGPLDTGATGQIVAERISVAGVRHVPYPFSVRGVDKQIANRSECSCARAAFPAGVTPVIADFEFANAKLVETGMPGLLIGESHREVRPIGRSRRPRPRSPIRASAAAMAICGSVGLPSDSRSALSRFAAWGEVVLNQERRRHRDPGKIRDVSVVGKQQNLA